MAKRKHLPVQAAGERYDGWMPFSDDEPLFMDSAYYAPPCAEVYATKKDARKTAEDVRHVTIIVTKTKRRE